MKPMLARQTLTANAALWYAIASVGLCRDKCILPERIPSILYFTPCMHCLASSHQSCNEGLVLLETHWYVYRSSERIETAEERT